jgi:hypothetical protein
MLVMLFSLLYMFSFFEVSLLFVVLVIVSQMLLGNQKLATVSCRAKASVARDSAQLAGSASLCTSSNVWLHTRPDFLKLFME